MLKRALAPRFHLALLLLLSCGPLVTGSHAGEEAAPANGVAAEASVQEDGDTPAIPPKVLRKMKKGAKSPYDQPAEAMQFYLEQRTGGGPLDYAALSQAKFRVKKMPKAVFSARGVEVYDPNTPLGALYEKAVGDLSNWTELGPGNVGGRTRAILIDPGNTNVMYAAGVSGGVWKSTNGGLGWTPLDDLMENLAVCSLVFALQGTPSVDTSVVYAGTGEGFFNGDHVRGAGVFKSTDSGATWTQLSATANSNFYYVNKLAASPNNGQDIYAATRTGVWKTSNGGVSWTRVLANDGGNTSTRTVVQTSEGFMDIEVRTDLGTDTLIASNGSLHSGDGVYRSTDGGATWSRVLTAAGMGRCDLAIAPSNQQYMYALAADRANGNRLLNVYRSTDGGANWSPRIAGSFDQTDVDWLLLTNPLYANFGLCGYGSPVPFNQGWYDNIIAVAPHDENIVFAGGIDVFRSDDGGANWGLIGYWWADGVPEYVHADHHALVFDPNWDGTSNQVLYSGNDGGIHVTSNALAAVSSGTDEDPYGICYYDGGISPTDVAWTSLNNGYGVTQFYHGRPYPDGSAYLGGTQDNGTNRGTDAAGTEGWVELYSGDGGYVSFDPTDTGTLFLETTYLSLRRTTDGGVSSAPIFASENATNGLFIAPFRHDPNDRDRIWYGGYAPFRSSNASSAINPGNVNWVKAGTTNTSSESISAWAIDPNDSNRVYYGREDGKVYGITNAGASNQLTAWSDLSPAWGGSAFVSWLEVDANDTLNNTVYATNSEFGAAHVMRSTNGGVSWTNITSNLPDIPAHCIVVQPGFSNVLFLGTDLGLFVSTDTGATWASMNTPDFTNAVVETLEFQDANTLFLFTHGRGAWRATVSSTPSAPDITVAPLSIDFGSREVSAGATAATSVTITNDGDLDLHLSGVGLAGANAAEFAIAVDTGEATLAPAATRTVQVAFDPASVGAKSALLRITSDDADEATVDVSLSGTGTVTLPSEVYVDAANLGFEDGSALNPYNTLQEGIDAVAVGGTIHTAAGTYTVAGNTATKACRIVSTGGTVRVNASP